MSNIFTESIRVYARQDSVIEPAESEWITWMLMGPTGSYWVPVFTRRHPSGRYADVQFGSGKGNGIGHFWESFGYRYQMMWGRCFDEGKTVDEIWRDDVEGSRRYCRYGFDQVRVATVGDRPPVAPDAPWRRQPDGSWTLTVDGSYHAGNDRSMSVGSAATPASACPEPGPTALATPTTPAENGGPLECIEPAWLAPLADEHPAVTLIEYRWRGRLVHRARRDASDDPEEAPYWQHRCADDWDNCLDADFLRAAGAGDLRAPAEAHEQGRRD